MIPIDKHILWGIGTEFFSPHVKSAEMIGDGVGSPRRPCFGLVSDQRGGESLQSLYLLWPKLSFRLSSPAVSRHHSVGVL